MRGLFLHRHVARGGKRAQHLALVVPVNGGVVKHVHDAPRRVADGQRVVLHVALGEYLPVAGTSVVRRGEVIGEVRADELLARHAGRLHGGFVHVGDLALRADGDERVERGLDQRARVGGGGALQFLGPFALGDVQCRADGLLHRTPGIAGEDGVAILKPAPFARLCAHPEFEVRMLAVAKRAHPLQVPGQARQVLWMHQGGKVLAAHRRDFLLGVADRRDHRPAHEDEGLFFEIVNMEHSQRDLRDTLEKVPAFAQRRMVHQPLAAEGVALDGVFDGPRQALGRRPTLAHVILGARADDLRAAFHRAGDHHYRTDSLFPVATHGGEHLKRVHVRQFEIQEHAIRRVVRVVE